MPGRDSRVLFFITAETKQARGQLCVNISEISVNISFSTCLNTENPHKNEMGTEENALSHVLHIFINYRRCPQCSSLQPI